MSTKFNQGKPYHGSETVTRSKGKGSGLALMRRFSCQEQRARAQERMEGYVNARPDLTL